MLTGQSLLKVQDSGIVSIPSCTNITFANGTLTNLGGGRASFSAPSTTPGGSSGQFQWNNAGSFAGAAFSAVSTSGTLLTLTAQTSTDIPLAVKGAGSQSGNLFEARNSSGTAIGWIAPLSLTTSGAVSYTGIEFRLYQGPGVNTSAIRPNSSGLGMDLVGGGALGQIFSTGQIRSDGGFNTSTSGNGTSLLLGFVGKATQTQGIGFPGSGSVGGYLQFYGEETSGGTAVLMAEMYPQNSSYAGTWLYGRVSSATVLRVVGATAQSANLTEWQNSSGTALASVSSAGKLYADNFKYTLTANLFIGDSAGNTSASGDGNLVVGGSALLSVTSGYENLAIGSSALRSLTTAQQNTAVGTNALYSCNGANNSAVGRNALFSVSSGFFNTGFGENAGSLITTGISNTYVGAYSGPVSGGGALSNSGGIGYAAVVSTSNTLALGGTAAGSADVSVVIGLSAKASSNPFLHGVCRSSSSVGMIVQGATSQSANLQEWQNSSGTALAYWNSDCSILNTPGSVDIGSQSNTGAVLKLRNGAFYFYDTSLGSVRFSGSVQGITFNGGVGGNVAVLECSRDADSAPYPVATFTANSSQHYGIRIVLAASAANDAFQVRNNSGTVLTAFDSAGKFGTFAGFADAVNVAVGTSTGTKIGTGTTQKLAFWNSTPVVQQVLATGAAHTVDDVITLLQTLGLCKQS